MLRAWEEASEHCRDLRLASLYKGEDLGVTLSDAGLVLLASGCCYCIIFMNYGSYKITNSSVWEGGINHPMSRVKLS